MILAGFCLTKSNPEIPKITRTMPKIKGGKLGLGREAILVPSNFKIPRALKINPTKTSTVASFAELLDIDSTKPAVFPMISDMILDPPLLGSLLAMGRDVGRLPRV